LKVNIQRPIGPQPETLQRQQLNYADKIAKVKSVGFYHGGDELYELKGVPGMWHEQCLKASVLPR